MYKEDLIAAVMGVLKVGKENAQTCEEIRKKANLKFGQFSNAIFYANQEFGIIKDKNGYYLPRDVEEAKKYYFKECNSVNSLIKNFKGIRNYIIEEEKLA